MSEPWGAKYVYYVYLEKKDMHRSALDGANALSEAYPEYNFIGTKVELVQEEPIDQIAT